MKRLLTILVVTLLMTVSCTKMTTTNRIEGTWTSEYSTLTYSNTYDDGYMYNQNSTTPIYKYEILKGSIIRYTFINPDGTFGGIEEYEITSMSKKEMTIDYGTGERTWTKVN